MRYSQIRAFHHVAIHGGFSRAAEVMSLTQPAVSEQVRKLEADHDVLLFDRARKQIELTPAGERLLLLTKRLFEVEETIDDLLSENRSALRGTLRIIADSAFHLTDRLMRFRARHPDVSISVLTGNSSQILAALRNYDAEIGIVGSLTPGNDMAAANLGTSRIVAFAAQGFDADPAAPRSLADLARQPLVLREKGSKTRQKLEDEAARQGVSLKPVAEVEGREAVREVVAAGVGIGFVSEAEFGIDPRLVTLNLTGAEMTMSESLVYLKQRGDVRVIREFMAA